MVQDVVLSVMRMVVGVLAQSPLARAVIFMPPLEIATPPVAPAGATPTSVSTTPMMIPNGFFMFILLKASDRIKIPKKQLTMCDVNIKPGSRLNKEAETTELVGKSDIVLRSASHAVEILGVGAKLLGIFV